MDLPIEDAKKEDKHEFYKQLKLEYESMAKYYVEMVMGDFNTKVRKSNIYENIK